MLKAGSEEQGFSDTKVLCCGKFAVVVVFYAQMLVQGPQYSDVQREGPLLGRHAFYPQCKGKMLEILLPYQREPQIFHLEEVLRENLFAEFPYGSRVPTDDQHASAFNCYLAPKIKIIPAIITSSCYFIWLTLVLRHGKAVIQCFCS